MRYLFILALSVFASFTHADDKDFVLDLFELLQIDPAFQEKIQFGLRVYYSQDNSGYQELQLRARNKAYERQLEREKERQILAAHNAGSQVHLDRIKGIKENEKSIYSTMDNIIKRNKAIRLLDAADARIHPRIIDANDKGVYVGGFGGENIIYLQDLDSRILNILDSPNTYVELLVLIKTATGTKLTEMTLTREDGKFAIVPVQSHRVNVCPGMF